MPDFAFVVLREYGCPAWRDYEVDVIAVHLSQASADEHARALHANAAAEKDIIARIHASRYSWSVVKAPLEP